MKKLQLTLVLLFLLGAGLPANVTAQASTSPAKVLSPDRIARSPDQYIGKQVTVGGRVLRLYGKQSFTLERGERDASADVLVLVPKMMSGLAENQELTITGVIRRFDPAGLKSAYSWFDTNIDAFSGVAALSESVVLIASSVRDQDGNVLWQAGGKIDDQQEQRRDKRSGANSTSPRRRSEEATIRVIEKALENAPGVNANNVDVDVINRTVTLAGTVESLPAKDRIVEVAEKTKGVWLVKDELVVQPVPRSDQEIRSNIRDAFAGDTVVDRYEIDVAVTNGIVRLAGKVESYQEKRLAAQIAQEVKGIRALQNEIEIRPVSTRSDPEIAAEVKNILRSDPYLDLRGITVNVNRARVNLTGVVDSAFDLARASSRAWVPGVETVNTRGLKVRAEGSPQSDVSTERVAEPAGARVPNLEESPDDDLELVQPVDEQLRDSILFGLQADARIERPFPKIEVQDQVVTLSGTVESLRAKFAAEERARLTPGVKSVYNRLKVRPQEKVSDEQLARQVRQALDLHPDVERYEIKARAVNGKVYLSGAVGSLLERRVAAQVASRIKGVTAVQNNIGVSYDMREWAFPGDQAAVYNLSGKTDGELREDIEEQLEWSPFIDSDDIKVSVRNGVVTLTGTVDSWRERSAAEENALEGGAKLMFNKIDVRD